MTLPIRAAVTASVAALALAFAGCDAITSNDVSPRYQPGLPSFNDRVYGEGPTTDATCVSSTDIVKAGGGELTPEDLFIRLARDAAMEARPDLFWAMPTTKSTNCPALGSASELIAR